MWNLLPTLFDELELVNRENQAKSGVRIGETSNALFVELPIPGVDRESIEVTYKKGVLTVRAQEKEESSDVKYLVRSSRQYAFQVGIPSSVNESSAPEATYKEGILKVVFEKTKHEQPLKISVRAE